MDKVTVTWYKKDLETLGAALESWVEQCNQALKDPETPDRKEVEEDQVRAIDLQQHVEWILSGECDQTKVNLDLDL